MLVIKQITDIDEILLSTEITDTIKKYLSNETKTYIIKSIKKHNENKFKRILNSLVATEIDREYGKETFIQIFAESVLNILVCAKLNDTTFMELFAESANKLSIEIKGLYENTKETLHKAIDRILLDTLEK